MVTEHRKLLKQSQKVTNARNMDVLSKYTSPVIEFKASHPLDRQRKLVDNCTGTDALLPSVDASTETQVQKHAFTQTERLVTDTDKVSCDMRVLAKWLRRMAPIMEEELLREPCSIGQQYIGPTNDCALHEEQQVRPYQKISIGSVENSQGLATWLGVQTNNAPALVVTTVAPHDDWCEHVNQQLKLFVPIRTTSGSTSVVYTERKTLPLKSCLHSLSTNPYDRNMFAGASMDGDILIWLYEPGRDRESSVEIRQLHSVSSSPGAAVALDWVTERQLLVGYSNGVIQQWFLGSQMMLEWQYKIPAITEVTTMIAITTDDFVVGTNAGKVLRCSSNDRKGPVTSAKQFDVSSLPQHRFMVSTLLKAKLDGHLNVISCDLSGQTFYHDMRLAEEETVQMVVQIPLPFKNAIASSPDGNIIYCPSNDGALEYYRVSDGAHALAKGALRGKGSLIKRSDNGYWLITGLYGDEFQIFYIE